MNCNDDRGVLQGKWDGQYGGGVAPTEWNGSAEILTRWAYSDFRPVRYGQCWVFACVLCTGGRGAVGGGGGCKGVEMMAGVVVDGTAWWWWWLTWESGVSLPH